MNNSETIQEKNVLHKEYYLIFLFCSEILKNGNNLIYLEEIVLHKQY